MKRHVYIAPYSGDPTVGYTFDGFTLTELVQPDSGDLYPPLPEDTVLVAATDADYALAYVNHMKACEDSGEVDPDAVLALSLMEADMRRIAPTLDYTYIGEVDW